MGHGCTTATSRKDEEFDGRKDGIDAIDLLLYCQNHFGSDDVAWAYVALRIVGSKVASDYEEGGLDISEELSIERIGEVCDEETYLGVEFVDCTIAFKAIAAFADSLAAYERGLTSVACLCVYFHD